MIELTALNHVLRLNWSMRLSLQVRIFFHTWTLAINKNNRSSRMQTLTHCKTHPTSLKETFAIAQVVMKMLGAPANINKNGLTATMIYFPDKKLLCPAHRLRPINTPAGLELVCGVNPFRLLYCWYDIAFWLRWSYLTVFICFVLILGHPGCPQPRELACFHFPAVGHNLGLFMEWL